jgi:DNA-directed RNA polymerase II subunit RPB1
VYSISGDNSLRVDEIGIPVKLAAALQIPETVRSYNKDKLNIYYMNKRNIYPGCSGIHIRGSGKFHKIEHLDPTYELQEGDIILRDLVEGDYIGFNRQPSLLFGQIGSHKIKIMEKSSTIRINVSACAPYNADFDGDAANGLIAQNIQSRTELQKMSWIGNWMVSYQNHSPYFGCFQDSLIGSAELTRSDITLDKWHAMQIFSNVTPPTEEGFNFDKLKYTGRELIGKFMPKINYPKKKASIYLPQYAPFIKYDPDEIYVQINRGELVSGTLDKATVGQQVMGSIFHIINNEYGANAALETIYNFHQIVSRFFLWRGFTVGIKDINISDEALQKIHEQTATMKEEARLITTRLNNRELIAPLGVKLSEFYEKEQLNALEPADSFVIPILNDIDFHNNKLAQLIFTGSKGKKTNLININGSYGQITINGRRPPRNFSWGRTSPYFLRYDTDPKSLGFVDTSYREGVEPEVYPFAAGDARFSSISNALSTSVSGAQSRISIKNLESIITNNLRQSTKDENIVQVLYAEAGVDTRKTEAVKFLTSLISEKEMKEQYHSTPKMFNAAYHNKDVESILNEEYKQLLDDRQTYREIYLWAENNNPGQYLLDHTQQMPVNPYRIIEDIIYNYEDTVDKLSKDQKVLDPVLTIKKVQQLCETIPYMYFNTYFEKRKQRIPEIHRTAVTLLCILIRTYLCTANLNRKKINNYHIDLIINKIKITFKNSLVDYGAAVGIIAAQCLSEPLTQFVLDSKHRGGGGGGTSLNVVERFKEILGAKATEDLKVPMMLIMVLQEFEKNKLKVQEIANHIEMMDFERFISSERVFFEPYGKPLHPKYKDEEKMIKTFEKNNAGMRMLGDITKWCIRYEINKEELIINSMKLDTIITKLRMMFPELFLVYTPENADTIIIRAYITQGMLKIPATGFSESLIFDLVKKISKTVIRGVKGITYTEVMHIARSEVQEDGSIMSTKVYGISTLGTNLEDVLENPYVDKYRTQTNSIAEFEEMYGIEATRQKIITEIRKTMSSDNVIREHTSIFADEMTYSGSTSSIQKTGLQIREASNVTLRLSFQSPIQVIENAAVNGIVDNINSVSGPLINGQCPNLGTVYNNVFIDEGFVEHYLKNLGKSIEDSL